MATKRDLVEAYSFSRRRLVTAFVSGAPGGREVEPTRPGRTIVGGLALAVLLVAGAAIAGIFAPRDPDEWNKPGLVVSKETGAAYVILEESEHPELRPVINITSARLILQGDIEPTLVSQDTIDEQIIGDDIGILSAPASLPTPSLLIDTGWTACTGDRLGLRLSIAEAPGARRVPTAGFLVESNKVNYVVAQARVADGEVAGAYRYELPTQRAGSRSDDQDNMLGDLGLPIRDDSARVSEDWMALFPTGGALDFASFGLTGFGDPVPYQASQGVPSGSKVGDVVTFPASDEETKSMLLTLEGPTVLDPFALTLYRYTTTPNGKLTPDRRRRGSPVETTQDEPPAATQITAPYAAAHWPDQIFQGDITERCAELTPVPGEAPTVQIATAPDDEASADGIPAAKRVAVVAPGRGAYVLSGSWTSESEGSPFVIDAKGKSYPLVGADTAARLGYGEVPVVVVPDSWVELFEPGVNLSVDAALCPPDRDVGQSCD